MSDEILTGLREIDAARNPIQASIDKLGKSGEGLTLSGGVDGRGNTGALFEAHKELGGDWSISAAAAWAKNAGYSALGKLTWRPK